MRRRPANVMGEWLIMAAAVVAGAVLFAAGRTPEVASELIDVSLIGDAASGVGRECAWHLSVGRYRCAFRTPGVTSGWAVPPSDAEHLRLVQTADGRTMLVAGLDTQPAPTDGGTLQCQLRLLTRVQGFQVRGLADGRWTATPRTWVAEPVACRAR